MNFKVEQSVRTLGFCSSDWSTVKEGSEDYCKGYIDAISTTNKNNSYRVVKSDEE